MTGKYLTMDVKSNVAQSFTVTLADQEGNPLTEAMAASAAGEDWENILLIPADALLADCDLTAVNAIVFNFGYAANTGAERSLNIDNVALVDMESVEDDLIHLPVMDDMPDMRFANMGLSAQYVASETSTVSMKLVAPEDDLGVVIYDVSSLNLKCRGTFTAWFYFGEDAAPTEVLASMIDNNAQTPVNDLPLTWGEAVNGWYPGTIDLRDFRFEDGVTAGNLMVFAFGIQPGATVYVDQLAYGEMVETAEDDLIHMLSSTNATIGSVKVHGNMSVSSLNVDATAKAINVDFEPDTALNFENGKVTAWFYFGDVTPGLVRFVAYSGASNSGYVTFTFGEGVDGWYLGTADMADVAEAKLGVLSSVDKFRIQVGKSTNVYIDELVFVPNETAE